MHTHHTRTLLSWPQTRLGLHTVHSVLCAYRGMYCREVGRGEGGDGRDTKALPFSLDRWSLSTGFSNPIRWRYAERRGGGASDAATLAE